jgi:hypothetical protein
MRRSGVRIRTLTFREALTRRVVWTRGRSSATPVALRPGRTASLATAGRSDHSGAALALSRSRVHSPDGFQTRPVRFPPALVTRPSPLVTSPCFDLPTFTVKCP